MDENEELRLEIQKQFEAKKRKLVNRKRVINFLIIVLGLVLVVGFVRYMQLQYSEKKNAKIAHAALTSVVENLDANTENVSMLMSRYHSDNNSVLEDIAKLFSTPKYAALSTASEEERCEIMEKLSEAIGNGFLFVIDKHGNIILAPQEEHIGDNLVKNGTFKTGQLEIITRKYDEGRLHFDGTSVITDTVSGKTKLSYDMVFATPAGSDIVAYFYSRALSNDYFVVYGVDSAILDLEFEAMRNLGPVLSNAVVGENGFVFAVDAETGSFMYYNDGAIDLSGENVSDHGLTSEALDDGYYGVQVIDGVSYQCLSRTYSSFLYGEYIVVSAVCSTAEVFAADELTVAVTALIFAISAILCVVYATLMHMDSEYLAEYDENVIDVANGKKRITREELKKTQIKNVRFMRIKDEGYFFKVGVAEKLTPVIAIGLALILIVSWNAQTLVEISKGMTESASATKQIDRLFANSENSSEIIMERYQSQYLSKLKLISYMIEEQPMLLFGSGKVGRGADSLHTYVDEDYNVLLGENGEEIHSIANSTGLQQIAENNGLDALYIFDDHGRVIATNTEYWYFILSDDKDDQSYMFTDILRGKVDDLIQQPMTDETGNFMQYVGTTFYYYNLVGEGELNGTMVSSSEYNEFLEKGVFAVPKGTREIEILDDSVPAEGEESEQTASKYTTVTVEDYDEYEVVMHRGMVQGGINDSTISDILASTQAEYLIRQVKVDNNGFVVLFDNSDEHICLWSPNEASIGKSAEQLNISSNAFSGSFKGFTNVNGVKYFQTYTFYNNYWVASAIPTEDLFVGRLPITVITVALCTLFFLVLFLICTVTSESEEKALVILFEKRVTERGDSHMVKITMRNGKEKYARAAQSRYGNVVIKWQDMIPSQKIARITTIIVDVAIVIIMICIIFADRIFGKESVFAYIVNGQWDHSFNYFAALAFTGMVLCVVAGASIISKFINFIISNMGTRVETVGRLMLSVIQYGSVLFSIFAGLSLMGVSTAGLVTSAGIMSVVIGLGSQSLITDILSGIFIVFEGSFRVGDIVTVDGFSGNVVDIGLRTTKIENRSGDIKIFNNSKINGILNMTKKASLAITEINLSYDVNLELIESLIRAELPIIKDTFPQIITDPVYVGITETGESYMKIGIAAGCAEFDRIPLTRALNRYMFLFLQRNGIERAFSKIKVYDETAEKADGISDYSDAFNEQ